jgi:hypothetical protein
MMDVEKTSGCFWISGLTETSDLAVEVVGPDNMNRGSQLQQWDISKGQIGVVDELPVTAT